MDDLIIRGGEIIDGTGAPSRTGDVAVQDGRIVAIGNSTGREARRVLLTSTPIPISPCP